MANRLRDASSPYLQQHRDNPVDWWPWGPEALEEARARDVPVLLSVGYAACHWCHVMAHESFEDEATARAMNASFVCVKVDREERPDVDAAYMAATTALTGHGGWPMTVFTTPDGRPFHAGTYYPPEPRHGMPSFRQLLDAVAYAWDTRRGDVDGAAGRIADALASREVPRGPAPPDAAALSAAVSALAGQEDAEHGGLGGAPKFPPSTVLEFLLRHAATDAPTATTARDVAGRTLHAMARSGTYDQVAGGFARYAVDAGWVVPHFEKMLYDNAQLARVYLHWWRLTGDPLGARVALETCDWMLAALGTPEGGLASSLDADTAVDGHAVEGATYVWTPRQLRDVLGEDDGAWAAQVLGVTAAGTFEHGTSTLRLVHDVWADPGERERWLRVRSRLLAARAGRPQPDRDDKVVAAWNGLAAAALAETGALLDRPDLVAAARGVAALLTSVHVAADGTLLRVSRDGAPGAAAGVLEDHGDVAEGMLALAAVTGEPAPAWFAGRLLDTVLADFTDAGGGLCDTSVRSGDPALAVLGRAADPADTAHPSGAAAAAGALLSWSSLSGSARHRDAAERALGGVAPLAQQAPRFAGWGLAVAQAALDGPREAVVVGAGWDAERLHLLALAGTAPGLVVARGAGTGQRAQALGDDAELPVVAGRPPVAGAAAGYLCRGQVCEAPTTDPAVWARAVAARPAAVGRPARASQGRGPAG